MASFMHNINTTSRCAVLHRAERLAGSGLNGNQCPYILNICRCPGVTQEELARAIRVNKSNVARQLALLEESGYVSRRASDDDRRSTQVFPTEKAREVLPRVQEVLREWSDFLMEDFSEQERALLAGFLERVARKADRWQELTAREVET